MVALFHQSEILAWLLIETDPDEQRQDEGEYCRPEAQTLRIFLLPCFHCHHRAIGRRIRNARDQRHET